MFEFVYCFVLFLATQCIFDMQSTWLIDLYRPTILAIMCISQQLKIQRAAHWAIKAQQNISQV